MPVLNPPFSQTAGLIPSSAGITLPAAVRYRRSEPLILPEQDIDLFLTNDLRTPRLEKLHTRLWLAGLPFPARPLHRQRIMGREICPTELPDEHLVWHCTKLFIKPLPEFLLSHEFWAEQLCSDPALHRSATGFLLSYSWLISHESDFFIARDAHLIPTRADWINWTAFMRDFLSHLDLDTLTQVDRRYKYGELRLSRLNSLTRYLPSEWSYRNLLYGYMTTSTWYQAFFERNFSWLLVIFVYLSVVLSALQVGLGAYEAGPVFNKLSYELALMSLASVAFSVGLIALVWFLLFWSHLLTTMDLKRKSEIKTKKILIEREQNQG
ncbi:hypothetical protein QBC38DRAFT_37882 [Podospora fimiseda]|uniref:Subtilisin-like serine protease n=1 Tax=Podospora fimiseda TaxID=252190 RepID=A0AAN7BIE9_9PEZI|nr:hypothetical protein QBC38DRAFT_37882 [Podospora fimiseda]